MKQSITLEEEALLDLDTSIAEDAVEYECSSDDFQLDSITKVLIAWGVGIILSAATLCGILYVEDEEKINRKVKTRNVTLRVKFKVKNTTRTKEIQYAF